jgi:hypothetical protein
MHLPDQYSLGTWGHLHVERPLRHKWQECKNTANPFTLLWKRIHLYYLKNNGREKNVSLCYWILSIFLPSGVQNTTVNVDDNTKTITPGQKLLLGSTITENCSECKPTEACFRYEMHQVILKTWTSKIIFSWNLEQNSNQKPFAGYGGAYL